MIVKMTILRLLGSSDDKEKIDVARPEGPHLRWFRIADGGRGGADSCRVRSLSFRFRCSAV